MAGLYSHTTRASGLVLTANIYNSDHQNHITNLSIDILGITYTDAAYDATTDGQSGGSRSKPTSLQGQLERLAFAVKQIKVLLSPAITNWWETISSLTGDGSGLTGISASDTVTNISTGTYTVTAAQMTGRVKFYNSIQTAITLPAAAVGLTATFEINHTGGVRFIRNGSDTFTIGETASLTALPVGGTAYDIVVGGIYELTCYVVNVWTVKRRGVQPEFKARLSGNLTLTLNTWILYAGATEVKDNNGDYINTAGNYTFTPTIPGKYEFRFAHNSSSSGGTFRLDSVISKDDATPASGIANRQLWGLVNEDLGVELTANDIANGSNVYRAYIKCLSFAGVSYVDATWGQQEFSAVRVTD